MPLTAAVPGACSFSRAGTGPGAHCAGEAVAGTAPTAAAAAGTGETGAVAASLVTVIVDCLRGQQQGVVRPRGERSLYVRNRLTGGVK